MSAAALPWVEAAQQKASAPLPWEEAARAAQTAAAPSPAPAPQDQFHAGDPDSRVITGYVRGIPIYGLRSQPTIPFVDKAAQGMAELATGKGPEGRTGGVADIIEGVGGPALMAAAPELAAAPISSAVGLGAGVVGGATAGALARAAGAGPGAARLTGDIAGTATGIAAGMAAGPAGRAVRNFVLPKAVTDLEPVQAATMALSGGKKLPNLPKTASTALPYIRSAANEAGIDLSKPIDLRTVRDLNGAAKAQLYESAIGNVIGQHAEVRLPLQGVSDAIVSVARGIDPMTAQANPGLIQSIGQRAQIYDGQTATMADVETRIQRLNAELDSVQQQAGRNYNVRTDPKYAPQMAELNALRSLQDQAFEQLAGQGSRQAKMAYGALKQFGQKLNDVIPQWDIQKARIAANAPAGGSGVGSAVIGAGLTAAGEPRFGLPIMVRAALSHMAGEARLNLRNPELLLQHAISSTDPAPSIIPPIPTNNFGTTSQAAAATPPANRGLALPPTTAAGPGARPLPPSPVRGALTAGEHAGPITVGPAPSAAPAPPFINPDTQFPSRRLQLPPATTRFAGPPEPTNEPMRVLPASKRIVRDPKTGRMMVQYLTSAQGNQ